MVLRTILVIYLTLFVFTSVQADDWPHWMGPSRDNVWKESGLLEKFPKNGPKVLWRAPLNGGYSGPAVVGDRVYFTDYVTADNVKSTGAERILCLDEATGKEIWKREYPVTYGVSYPAGPRCTPVVDGDMVYTLGAEGHLYALNAKTGATIWAKELKKEYNTESALWGYASHPLIDGDKLICLAGREGCHVVALNKKTGKELWRSQTAPEQGYSPPRIIEAGGVRQLIVLSPASVASLNPENGDLYWSEPYEATNGSIIMAPVQVGDYLFVAGYSNKNLLLKLNPDEPDAEVVWQNEKRKAISPVNVQPIAVDGTVYGFDQGGKLMGIEIPSGKRLWETSAPVKKRADGSGTAFLVQQADRFWMFNELGEIVIAKLSPTGYEEIDRAKVIEPTNVAFGRDVVWCMPAFAHKKMFVRNDKECICVDLSADQ
jgi:outer membrane protein assembly factor BamB